MLFRFFFVSFRFFRFFRFSGVHFWLIFAPIYFIFDNLKIFLFFVLNLHLANFIFTVPGSVANQSTMLFSLLSYVRWNTFFFYFLSRFLFHFCCKYCFHVIISYHVKTSLIFLFFLFFLLFISFPPFSFHFTNCIRTETRWNQWIFLILWSSSIIIFFSFFFYQFCRFGGTPYFFSISKNSFAP